MGVCEVKGLEGSADRRNLRQLLDYYIEQRDIEERNVKGILIVNHYRNQKPNDRGNPATPEGMDLAKKHNFCILSTAELYNLLIQFWQNKITKEDFLKRFLE